MKVLIVGGVSHDSILLVSKFFTPEPQTVFRKKSHETLGSTGAGKALNFQKPGFSTTMHRMTGKDEFGEKIKRSITKEGIRLLFDEDPNGTERHFNSMDDNGDRISIYATYVTAWPQSRTGIVKRIERVCKAIIYPFFLLKFTTI